MSDEPTNPQAEPAPLIHEPSDTFPEAPPADKPPREFTVLKTQVGPFKRGRTFTEDEFRASHRLAKTDEDGEKRKPEDIDAEYGGNLARLVKQGAIKEVTPK